MTPTVDHLGTPRRTYGDSGITLEAVSYYPFGALATATQGPADETLRFTGHERDSAIGGGVDYMHARFYAPGVGRFLSVDPGRDWDPFRPQSWNLFSYVRNRASNFSDPSGRCGEDPNFIGPVQPCPKRDPEHEGGDAESLNRLPRRLDDPDVLTVTIASVAFIVDRYGSVYLNVPNPLAGVQEFSSASNVLSPLLGSAADMPSASVMFGSYATPEKPSSRILNGFIEGPSLATGGGSFFGARRSVSLAPRGISTPPLYEYGLTTPDLQVISGGYTVRLWGCRGC